ncbi:peptide ABC transporter [Marivita cryptomonadis]|jgi:peptide/nickel transport system substrate-binding protein|uniref:peptide ABC transporter substrate-binding protein n=1 Tax=Marivita cryptomonadis TaxID=505252 RepID=UPI000A1F9BDA|nr:peptide ABC transporter substrate-binding protein [Marivita cryptomonadis]OSQ53949.1 peptide ABC transporter [Marivita cryptomonadis]
MKRFVLMAGTALTLLPMAASAERGSDGDLNILYWQAASTMNPYLSGIAKEVEAASLVLEPLARFDETGALVPILAEDIPTVENGGVGPDLTTITWKLRDGLLWSDGSPVTAQDAVFTWKYCTDDASGCAALSQFDGVADVVALDGRTIEVQFSEPKPYPYSAFVSSEAPLLQATQFADCTGARVAQCTEQNTHPIGTGPYVVEDFRANDVITYVMNPNYREADKPAFATVTIKGGGDPASAARAVLQTGEVDYAWNLQLSPDVLAQMAGGPGEPITGDGPAVEFLFLNQTDPDPALGETRSTLAAGPHPFLSDPRVGKALSMAIDRTLIAEALYGDAGQPGCAVVPAPDLYKSDANDGCVVQDLDGAKALLDEAGWSDSDGDGVRDKDGKPLSILFQTSTNGVRQDSQALIKDWWQQIGVETELRNIDASVFFGGDPGSPDTRQKFYADVQMYTDNSKGQDPEAFLGNWSCANIPSPETQWQGNNIQRFCSDDYETLIKEFRTAASLEERGEIARAMNDLLVQSYSIVPLIHRRIISGKAKTLAGVRMNSWDSQIWNIADWYRAE